VNATAQQLKDESFAFAVRVVALSRRLVAEQNDYVISKQILKRGTSIGANIREAQFAQTKPDFITKMTISLKEASETQYWLELLQASQMIGETEYASLKASCDRLVGTLVNVVKSAKGIK